MAQHEKQIHKSNCKHLQQKQRRGRRGEAVRVLGGADPGIPEVRRGAVEEMHP